MQGSKKQPCQLKLKQACPFNSKIEATQRFQFYRHITCLEAPRFSLLFQNFAGLLVLHGEKLLEYRNFFYRTYLTIFGEMEIVGDLPTSNFSLADSVNGLPKTFHACRTRLARVTNLHLVNRGFSATPISASLRFRPTWVASH